MRSSRFRVALAFAVLLVVASCGESPQPSAPTDENSVAAAPGGQSRAARFQQASIDVLGLPGAVFADDDETNGRMRFGVEHAGAANAVRGALGRLGIEESEYTIDITPAIQPMVTLRDKFESTQAGIQLHFEQYVCTLGFNVDDGAERSFITNSHCTKKQGGVQGTQYYQPTRTLDPVSIATEVEDPEYFSGGVCPKGRKCRYSDASRARYASGASSSRGVIAKTTGANNGSLTVAGAFTITAQNNTATSFPLGTVVNKVGRTTGWTRGEVTGTCVHTNISGTNLTLLCQTFVEDAGGATVVGGGDSGSGVFRVTSGDNVELVGILWGGDNPGKLFVFTPLKQIRDELGALFATN